MQTSLECRDMLRRAWCWDWTWEGGSPLKDNNMYIAQGSCKE